MTEKALKEEIKLLKEKLGKKSKRVSELAKKNKQLKTMGDRWFREYDLMRDKYWNMRRNFHEKYYRVEWSGINQEGNRNSPKVELKKGICAAEIIGDLEAGYQSVKIHMIEEVAT